MRYTKFEIRNFKGIENLTIDLSKQPYNRIHTFVGLNESGKTTILEAINAIGNKWNPIEAQKLIPKHLKASFNNDISISAYVEVDEEDNKRILKKLKEFGYSKFKPIAFFTINSCWKFKSSRFQELISYWNLSVEVQKTNSRKYISLDDTNDHWQAIVHYIEDSLMPRIVYYKNLLFEFPDRIYLYGPRADKGNNKAYKDIIEDIVQEVIEGNGSIEKSLYEIYIQQDIGAKDIFRARKNLLQEYITRQVFASWGNLFKSAETTAKIELHFDLSTDQARNTDSDFYVEIHIEENSDSFYISERSVGFRWFFSFLFFILFRKNRKTDLGETLFLLDEPASNLHSTAQKKLLATFEHFVEDENKPLKLLYTTHSHHMINPKWLEGAFVVKNEAVDYANPFGYRKVTNITAVPYKHFVAEFPNQQDYFQPVLDTLEYQPGLLEKVPNIIITEGKNDYYTLRYINEVLLNNKYKKIHLLPGAGCEKNHSVIQLYMAWNKPYMILLDADKAGVKAQQTYLKIFGDIIAKNIKTYNDLNSEIGTVTMENIFSEEEKISISKHFDPTLNSFKKSAFNTAIQSALINKEKIELSDETVNKFDKLLGQLNSYKFV